MAKIIDKKNNAKPEERFSGHSSGMISVNKEKYAIGLIWDISDKPNDKEKVKKIAEEEKGNLFCYNKNKTIQFGIGSNQVHDDGIKSLAATISANYKDDLIAIFHIQDDLYYYYSSTDQLINSNSDIIGTKEDIQNIFSNFIQELGSQEESFNFNAESQDGEESSSFSHMLILPENWIMDDSLRYQTKTIEEFSKTLKKKVSLSQVSPKGPIVLIVLLIALAGAGYFGYHKYKAYEKEQAIKLQQTEAHARIMALKIKEERAYADRKYPWYNKPAGFFTTGFCEKSIDDVNLIGPKWKITDITCSKGILSSIAQSNGGTITWLRDFYNTNNYHKISIGWGGGAAADITQNYSKIYNNLPSYTNVTFKASLSASEVYLKEQFQEIRTPITLSLHNPYSNIAQIKKMPPAKRKAFLLKNMPYEYIEFSYTSKFSPKNFAYIFKPFNVFVLTSMKYSVQSNQWTVLGRVYAPYPPAFNLR